MNYVLDPRRLALVAHAIGRLGVERAFETGCFEGETFRWLSRFAGVVKGCDLSEDAVKSALALTEARGLSDRVFHEVMDSRAFLTREADVEGAAALPSFFYLDANWRKEWFGWEELAIIRSRWDAPLVDMNAVASAEHGNFIGRPESLELRDHVGGWTQVLTPRYPTHIPVAGYAIFNGSPVRIPFDRADYVDVLEQVE